MKPGTERVLILLRRHPDGLTPLQAMTYGAGMRLAARIAELREAGYVIDCDRSEGYGRYQLREPAGQLRAGL